MRHQKVLLNSWHSHVPNLQYMYMKEFCCIYRLTQGSLELLGHNSIL